VKTINVRLEIEYTGDKPDSVELARYIEMMFSDRSRGTRVNVRIVSDDRDDHRGCVVRS
jgi:hypothetical protein